MRPCPRQLTGAMLFTDTFCTHTFPCSLQSKVLRLGFENQHEAEEWYALVAIAMQTMPHDHQRLEKLPLARAASTKMLPSSVIAEGAAYKDK